jgi:hypothetical protein
MRRPGIDCRHRRRCRKRRPVPSQCTMFWRTSQPRCRGSRWPFRRRSFRRPAGRRVGQSRWTAHGLGKPRRATTKLGAAGLGARRFGTARVRTARVRTARVRTARVRTARVRTARVRTARFRTTAALHTSQSAWFLHFGGHRKLAGRPGSARPLRPVILGLGAPKQRLIATSPGVEGVLKASSSG